MRRFRQGSGLPAIVIHGVAKFMRRTHPASVLTVLLACAIAGMLLAATASASELVDRRTKHERIRVNSSGVAMVTYRARGKNHHVAYWGAINARKLMFRHDRSGGVVHGVADPNHFTDRCRPYSGPRLRHVVDACTMSDGSSWVLQRWARIKPNYGGKRGAPELRVSHFRGPVAVLRAQADWSWGGRYDHVYGTFTYRGRPWYAVKYTSTGENLDRIGRNIAIESRYSDYHNGTGWRRVNAILSHRPSGQFCFGFSPKGGSPYSGKSATGEYRLLVPGPGVSPDVFLNFRGQPGPYDPVLDAFYNQQQFALIGTYTGPHNCQKIN